MLLLYIITLLNDFLLDAIYVVSSTYLSIFYFFFLCRPLLILYKYPNIAKKLRLIINYIGITNRQSVSIGTPIVCFVVHYYPPYLRSRHVLPCII